MAVKLVTNAKKYQCLSSDEMPEGPPEGSTLHIVDTGETYVFVDGIWTYDLRLSTAIKQI